MTKQISEPKDTIRELTLNEIEAVSGGDGGGGSGQPCPPGAVCGDGDAADGW